MTCKDCTHEELCKDRLSKQGYSNYAKRNLIVEDCEYFKNKADFVEVVRCEKCRAFDEYHYPVEDFDGRCILDGIERDKDFYCGYGKMK